MRPIQLQIPPTLRPLVILKRKSSLRTIILCHSTSTPDGGSPATPLPPPPNLRGKAPRKYWNPASLAFLGDSVWEVSRAHSYIYLLKQTKPSTYDVWMQLYVRRRNFYPPSRVSEYYAVVVSQVRAEAQAESFRALEGGTFLTQDEKDVLRWGRNATGTSPKRLSQGGMTREIYRAATAIECLVSVFLKKYSKSFKQSCLF